MKPIKTLLSGTFISTLALALAVISLSSRVATAHPYASNVTGTNASGLVGFTLNEDGAYVTVVYEDGTTNSVMDGTFTLSKGPQLFLLEPPHVGFRIICYKQGTGSPSIISSDAVGVYTYTNSVWNAPAGCAANKNPAIGTNFGRVYVANNAAGAQASGPKALGIYALNADQTFVAFAGSPTGTNFLGSINANFKSPGRIRVAPDNRLLVSDSSGANNPNQIYLFQPDLSSSIVLLGPSRATGAGDHFGTPVMFGSEAAGNLVLYTAQAGLPTPSVNDTGNDYTNCIRGPGTSPGSFNCIYKYNIGSGPLPWNKRPDWAYTVGLDGIAQLRPEIDVEPDGKLVASIGRANGSNPNIQILAPAITTNSAPWFTNNADFLNLIAGSATNWIYTSGAIPPNNVPTVGDPWAGANGSGTVNGMYAGVRVSRDGRFLASVDLNNGVTLAFLTNGVPNDATIFGIDQGTFAYTAPAGVAGIGAEVANSRGMDWDAADNVWVTSSGNALLRCFSLGLTTTCTTSNDWTGTNGTFELVLPGAAASVVAVQTNASQNYVNNNTAGQGPGTPIPGVFRISLNVSSNPTPVAVSFTRGGTATYVVNYGLNTNATPNGVTITPTNVIFPAGLFSGSNGPNWNVDVEVIPTATPVSGPTLTATMRLNGGTNYFAAPPLNDTVVILNTGPQLLQLSAAAPATLGNMNRGIPNDYARFVITRLGDTNGPGNGTNAVVARSLTVTNFNYGGTAQYPLDYGARAQNFNGAAPVNGEPGIVIPAGAVTVRGMIGNPVKHTNTSQKATNVTVVINLTNVCDTGATPGCNTNAISSENFAYSVNTTALTLNEFDNALGGEVVLWSNPLTNALDSTNWTLVFASIVQGGCPTLPDVISNYDNSLTSLPGTPYVNFGKAVPATDDGIVIPQSDTMLANNWSNALKVSVNKNPGSAGESGVNLYPQVPGQPIAAGVPVTNLLTFGGNYALRFDMFLSLYDLGSNNPNIGTPAREFAAFGINHYGTNANWRLDINPRANGTGSRPINADGEWCCIDAASGSITPADYDMFISPNFVPTDANGAPVGQTIPFTSILVTNAPFTNAANACNVTNVFGNGGVPNDQQSANNNAIAGAPQNGVIKSPPFGGINQNGGAPDNAWVDVSLELTRQTNLSLLIARQQIFSSSITNPIFGTINVLAPMTGTPMLGYLDPNINISDFSAFVYYSNIRLVELSPFIPWTNQPVAGLIVTQGATFSLSSGALFASNPLTNTWYNCTTNSAGAATSRESLTTTGPIITNVFAATNAVTNLTVANIQSGTNYVSIWSDTAGAVTNWRTIVEVIAGPANKTTNSGAIVSMAVVASGNAPPTSFQWKFAGTNLVNSTHYSGVTAATLFITNVQPADAGFYSNVVVNAFGTVTPGATLTVIAPPSSAIVSPTVTNRPWGSSVAFVLSSVSGTPPFGYQWKRGGNNLSDGPNVNGSTTTALTLSNLTTTVGGPLNQYQVSVSNSAGTTLSSAATLTVDVPPPNIGAISVTSSNVSISFTTTNSFDTTGAWTLQTNSVVTGPYIDDTSATFTTSGGGNFQVTTTNVNSAQMFYRLLHVP